MQGTLLRQAIAIFLRVDEVAWTYKHRYASCHKFKQYDEGL